MAKSRVTAKDYQIWWDPAWERMRLSEWNACGCHPGDLIETWGDRNGQDGWYGQKDKNKMTEDRLSRGWILLDSAPSHREEVE